MFIIEVAENIVHEDHFNTFQPFLTFTTVFVDTRLWKKKTPAETFPKFPSILLVVDMSDRNAPITTRYHDIEMVRRSH